MTVATSTKVSEAKEKLETIGRVIRREDKINTTRPFDRGAFIANVDLSERMTTQLTALYASMNSDEMSEITDWFFDNSGRIFRTGGL